jgi:hypothetical protein
VLFLAVTFLLPLRAQNVPNDGRDAPDGPIKMSPEFALAIPFAQHGRDVTVQFPVLMNRTTIIKPGMILRNIYVPPVQSDSQDLVIAHHGDMEQAYSRQPSSDSSDSTPRLPPEIAHAIEGERRTVWEVPVNFQLAMAQLPTDNLHLIYCPTPNDNRNIKDERFDFYEGLLLGSPTGKVTVLAVEIGSKADKGGFKAGDNIVSIGGTPVPDDLGAFPNLYVAARENAKETNAANLPFVVESGGQRRTVGMAMPPTIKSMLMEGF